MKKVFAILFAMFLLFGCSKKSTESQAKGVKSQSKKADSSLLPKDDVKIGFVYISSIDDAGYTYSQDKARLALLNAGYKNVYYVENVPENTDCEKVIRDLIDLGCNLIYTTSYGFMDWTLKVAKDFPEVKFAHCSGNKRAENVSTYFGKMFEARYLSGIVAGLKTKTNKIGYVAAFQIPECIRGINAFMLGAHSVNKNAKVIVEWTNTWYDPEHEKLCAKDAIAKGCDIIAQHQDTTACQLTAAENGVFSIGYNTPTPFAAPSAYLCAPIFHWEAFILDDVEQYRRGQWKSRAYWEGLSEGVVDISPLSQLCASGTSALVEKAKKEIIDGTLKIFKGPLIDNKGVIRAQKDYVLSDDDIWNMDWLIQDVEEAPALK